MNEQDHLIPSRQGRSGDDLIFALDREARERRAAGEDVVNATLGALLADDGQLAILPTAARTVQDVAALDWAAYAPIEGLPAYRQAVIADTWGSFTEAAERSLAFATPGGTGALRHAIATFLEPGQAFLTTSFYWGPYQTLADEQERALKTFPMFSGPEAAALNLPALEQALGDLLREQGRALLILNDPCHNPSGYSMSTEDWKGVCAIIEAQAQAGPITVLLDNAYAAFGPPGAMDIAREALERLSHVALVLVAWSASKSFTHYGLRTGALVACVPDAQRRVEVANALSTACRGTWGNCVRGGQAAIARLLEEPGLVSAVRSERSALVEILNARVEAFNAAAAGSSLCYPHYQGGFFTTVFHPTPEPAAERLRAAGVFVVPIPGGLRLGLCALPAAQIPRCVEALALVAQASA